MTAAELSTSDFFFYYDQVDQHLLTESDLYSLLTQPAGALFYNYEYGAGISNAENAPNGITLEIILRYAILTALATRNSRVASGQDNLPDRRVASSQQAIEISRDGGELNITLNYIEYADMSSLRQVSNRGGR